MNFDTRSIPLRTPAKMMVSVMSAKMIKQISADTPSRDEHRKISVLRKLCSVAANVFKKIFDDPAADNGIVRHNQNRDNGVYPAAELSMPCDFAEGCKCTHRAFAASCGRAMFLPRSSCNRTSAQAKCRSKGKCRRRILPQGTEIAKCCQDRPKRRPQTARTRAYPRTCCDYCDVSSLLLHLFSANIQTQPPVKPFSPFSFTGVLHQYVSAYHMGRKNAISCFHKFILRFLFILCLIIGAALFSPSRVRHPSRRL